MLHFPLQVLRGTPESGQTMVEFALALPLLMFVIFGMLDVGKAVSYKQDLAHLANEAARYATVDGAPPGYTGNTAIVDGEKAEASTNELRNGGSGIAGSGLSAPGAITFCYSGTGKVVNNDFIRATFTVSYQWLHYMGTISNKFLNPQTVSASATMRLEHDYDGATYTATQCT